MSYSRATRSSPRRDGPRQSARIERVSWETTGKADAPNGCTSHYDWMTETPVRSEGSRFIETAQAKVSWRPIRLAYLIRAGNRDDLIDAITYASTEWGGVSHPMLPVDRRGRIAPMDRQISEMLKPDFLVNYAGATHDLVQRVARAINADPIFGRDVQFGLHPLAVESSSSLRARTLFVPASKQGLRDAAALGRIPPEQFSEWSAVVGNIEPAIRPIDVLEGQLSIPSPIGITRGGAATVQHSVWIGGPVIVDCWPATFRRAVWFWNFRALAVPGWGGEPTRVVWLPDPALDDLDVQSRLREACLSGNTDPDLVLNGPDPGRLHEIGRALGFSESAGSRTSARFELGGRSRDLAERPLRYRVNGHPATWLFGDRRYGIATPTAVPVTKPRMMFQAESPIRCLPGTGGHVRVSVSGIEDLRWPTRPTVARLIERNASYRDGELSLVLGTVPAFTFNLSVPEAEEVVTAILGERGWTWATSDKGRYAQSLEAAAGLHVGSLASPEVLAFIQALASLSRRKAEQLIRGLGKFPTDSDRIVAVERLQAREPRWRTLGEIAGDLKVVRKSLIPLTEPLIEAGLLRRAYRMRCRACGLPWHVELNRADDIVGCPGCFSRQALIGPAGQEPDLAYSLNSLLDRALDQDCVSHVLAEFVVRQSRAVVWSVPGANVFGPEGAKREVDLLAISRDALIVGELKTRSTAFNRTFVRDLGDLARELGADALLLGSLDEWSTELRSSAPEWVGSGLETIMLGRADLLPGL